MALPSEHGGWGLTLEPALLGLLVRPSLAGLALGLGAFVAFLARTPLKVVLVDRHRRRWLPRSSLALRILLAEVALLAVLATVGLVAAGWSWLVPAALAAPLVALELWFDMRSRSRRLLPELAGALGIAAVAPAIVVAGGGSTALAAGTWLVLSARSVAAIPFVRVQIERLRHGTGAIRLSDLAQLGGAVLALVAVVVDRRMWLGVVVVAVLLVAEAVAVRRPPVPATRLGVAQLVAGLVLVGFTAAGVWLG
ncbi:YwiC-like family protein [Rhabdothermincola salaria]|uniref:YwiC-like family protein n=1 Tax=Rhabdothermincola salaria TaxID=2903142 RepID=UPI001E46C3C8|nr:YwiC-like family protein [Rhabdothermincola salaria]